MAQNEMNKVIRNAAVAVEGFDPDQYKQYYDNGIPYLPFKVQLAWFRMKYPNGKLPVFRPEWSEDKMANTYVATARVYKDVNDPQDAYLAEASAKRGPGIKVVGTEEEIDPYNAVQVAAMSMALKMAGFWCSLTDDDLTKELEVANQENKENSEPAESADSMTPETQNDESKAEAEDTDKTTEGSEKPTKQKRGRKTKAEKAAEEQAAKKNTSENTGETETLPDAVGAESVPNPDVPDTPDTVSNDEKVESIDSENVNPVQEESTTEPADKSDESEHKKVTDSEAESSEIPEETVETVTATVEDEPTTGAESEAESSTQEMETTAENVEETVEKEDNSTEETTEASSEPVDSENNPDNAETEAAEPVKESPVLTPENEAKLVELRATEFNNGYYNGTLGDLEEKKVKKLNGDNSNDVELGANLFNWLISSSMAKRKNAAAVAAAFELASLAHPDWLN